MDNRLYWIWLQSIFAPGSLKPDCLLREYGSAREIYHAPAGEMERFGLSKTELDRLSDKSLAVSRRILNRALENGDGF